MKKLLLLSMSLFSASVFAETKTVKPFELAWMNAEKADTKYKSKDHPEGIFVLENYFLRCPYCNYNAPNVNDLADKYKDDKVVQILDVGIDSSTNDYKTWISKHSPNHPVLKDATRLLATQLEIEGYPTTVILNCKMEEVYRTVGLWEESTIEEMHKTIDKLKEQKLCAPEDDENGEDTPDEN